MAYEDIPVNPPGEWFQAPLEGIPTDKRITIQADGRVYGYIALWNTCHVGRPNCVTAPKGSPSDYEYAHQGDALTAEGNEIKIAVIAGGTNHAPLDLDTALVPDYYENTGTQLMRVRYGEDDKGLWFSGALWPGVNDLQVAQIRASSISGDWRWHAAWRKTSTGYDFAGACFVNIPGFPMQAKGNNGDRPGRPFALAASAYMNLDSEGEYVYLSEDTTDNGGTEMDDCDGNCTECTCDKSVVEVEVAQEDLDELQASGYQLEGKKLKKNKKTLKADASEEEVVDTTQSDILATLNAVKETVDWLVADKLADQIINSENDPA